MKNYNKITYRLKKTIVRKYRSGISYRKLALEYGVGKSTICDWNRNFKDCSTYDLLDKRKRKINKLKKTIKLLRRENRKLTKENTFFNLSFFGYATVILFFF